MTEPRMTLDPVPPEDRQGLIRYPIPLQGLRHAVLALPRDLTRGDVSRMVTLLETLVVPDPPPARPADPPWQLDPL